MSSGPGNETIPRSSINEASLPEVNESGIGEAGPSAQVLSQQFTPTRQKGPDDEKVHFNIGTASVALATFSTREASSITPEDIGHILRWGKICINKFGLKPETDHDSAIKLLNKHGRIDIDELGISVKFKFVQSQIFTGELDDDERVDEAFDRFSGAFSAGTGILNVDNMYICVQRTEPADGEDSWHFFDPVGNGTVAINDGEKKATVVRCSKDVLKDYLMNVFTGSSTPKFTITPVMITAERAPGRKRN